MSVRTRIKSAAVVICLTMFAAAWASAQEQQPASETSAAAPSSAEDIAIPEYTARHTFEIHQVSLLHKMIQDNLVLSPEQKAKIDREIVDFICRTMEDKPRPILIAYSAQTKVTYEGKEVEPGGDTADELAKDKRATGEFTRPLLVDLIRDHLDFVQFPRFQVTVTRWNILRPPPIDDGLQRLGRALSDPQLGLRKETLDAAFAEFKSVVEDVPKPDRQPTKADKYEPQARKRVLAKLPSEKAEAVQKLLAWMEADYLEWHEPRHVVEVYKDAVRTRAKLEAQPSEDSAAAEKATAEKPK